MKSHSKKNKIKFKKEKINDSIINYINRWKNSGKINIMKFATSRKCNDTCLPLHSNNLRINTQVLKERENLTERLNKKKIKILNLKKISTVEKPMTKRGTSHVVDNGLTQHKLTERKINFNKNSINSEQTKIIEQNPYKKENGLKNNSHHFKANNKNNKIEQPFSLNKKMHKNFTEETFDKNNLIFSENNENLKTHIIRNKNLIKKLMNENNRYLNILSINANSKKINNKNNQNNLQK